MQENTIMLKLDSKLICVTSTFPNLYYTTFCLVYTRNLPLQVESVGMDYLKVAQ